MSNLVNISVRTDASGEWLDSGQLKSILTNAFGVKNMVSGLYHNLENGDFLNIRGYLACSDQMKLSEQ